VTDEPKTVIFIEGPARAVKLVDGDAEIDLGHPTGFHITGMNVGEVPRVEVTYSSGIKVIFT
jgi:hypothetical protein